MPPNHNGLHFGFCLVNVKRENDWEDDDVFFNRAGTCLDDEWVHNGPPLSEDSSHNNSYGQLDDSGNDDPSWWAFIPEYYASDSGTTSVNKHPSTIRHLAMSGYGTPNNQSPQKETTTPSSYASNDPDLRNETPCPYMPKYLRRCQPKKLKF
ncbi:hypothetical protein Salat_0190900 [Sesamum alatum]|uniref:Uncharacterized protein n=1 Tax=Sesamum alatum TaxID=300844 RepID=A0AAE1YYC8_9LAMI|nr:hypothetical protein Salat_0190900 [Sesamum alatum]